MAVPSFRALWLGFRCNDVRVSVLSARRSPIEIKPPSFAFRCDSRGAPVSTRAQVFSQHSLAMELRAGTLLEWYKPSRLVFRGHEGTRRYDLRQVVVARCVSEITSYVTSRAARARIEMQGKQIVASRNVTTRVRGGCVHSGNVSRSNCITGSAFHEPYATLALRRAMETTSGAEHICTQ